MTAPDATRSPAGPYKYWAFISYSHQDNRDTRADGKRGCVTWGTWLHEALELYRIPAELRGRTSGRVDPVPDRMYPLFRDEAELPATADLGESIRRALELSRFLIVVCSPRAARSVYCNEEVRLFKALGRGDRILPLIVDGEPNASVGNKRGVDASTECFMPALIHPVRADGTVDESRRDVEPICADARTGDAKLEPGAAAWRALPAKQSEAVLRLVAGIIGVGFDELFQRDLKRQQQEARAQELRQRRLTLVGVAATLALSLVCLLDLQPRPWLRLQGFDLLQTLQPRARASAPVVVAAIDEEALAAYGQWPWPRTRIAQLVERIGAARPAAIGLDILMSEPDRLSPARILASTPILDPVVARHIAALPDNDVLLGETIGAHPVVVAVVGIDGNGSPAPNPSRVAVEDVSAIADIPTFSAMLRSVATIEARAAGLGALNGANDGNTARRGRLFIRVGDSLVPSMAVELLRLASGNVRVNLRGRDPGTRVLEVGGLIVPAPPGGELWLRLGPPDPSRYLSAARILDGKFDSGALTRKIVIVGVTGLGMLDTVVMPQGWSVSGVELNMQFLENLYDRTWLVRPDWAPIAENLALLCFGMLLAVMTPRLRGATPLVIAGAILLTMGSIGPAAYSFGWLIDSATPALGMLLVFIAIAAASVGQTQARQAR